jgi:hypothetical protein
VRCIVGTSIGDQQRTAVYITMRTKKEVMVVRLDVPIELLMKIHVLLCVTPY